MAFLVSLSRALSQPLSHDEHQFVASGALLSTTGKLPYIDFPYHHVPNLIFINAAVNLLSPYLLLNARLISSAAASLSAILIYLVLRKLINDQAPFGWFIPVIGVLLFLFNPFSDYASGRAWNHDLPLALALLSTWLALKWADSKERRVFVLACGVSLGFASGTRLTTALLMIPIAMYLIFASYRLGLVSTLRSLTWFSAGFLIGISPVLVLASFAPGEFWYGNFIYPSLNTTYRELLGHNYPLTPLGNLRYFYDTLIAEPWTLLLGTVLLTQIFMIGIGKRKLKDKELLLFAFMVGILGFQLLGAFLPTPSWRQYFYSPITFVILAALYGLHLLRNFSRSIKGLILLVILGAALNYALQFKVVHALSRILRPQQSVPMQSHALGLILRDKVNSGKVLTLGSLLPLEGGLQIYPTFVTGPFTWRTAGIMPRSTRLMYGAVSQEELEDYLLGDEPGAILIGLERGNVGLPAPGYEDFGGLELPFKEYGWINAYKEDHIIAPMFAEPLILMLRDQ